MRLNPHPELKTDQHAFLSPSQYHRFHYTDEKLISAYENANATELGTKLHALAAGLIEQKIEQKKTKQAFNAYVNDAIKYEMSVEQPLKYSENCFGWADSIKFDGSLLRIHDLKTGVTPASIEQLELYAAIFCLEYRVNPMDIKIELRLYQGTEVTMSNPDGMYILEKMDWIVHADEVLSAYKNALKE